MKFITVKFLTDQRIVDYVLKKTLYVLHDLILIENAKEKDVARVIEVYSANSNKNEKGDGKIIRKVSKSDKKIILENKQKALEYIPKCKEIVNLHKFDMNIIDADLSYDHKKLTIYFSADRRIDFRRLVGDLVKEFKKLIRLQQIGAREQVQRTGGFGKCGQEVCCARFLDQLGEINIDLVKNQGLFEVSGNKINGVCGKLMCCLKYENEVYSKIRKTMPAIGAKIKTKQGIGKVIKQNILTKTVIVKISDQEKIEVEV